MKENNTFNFNQICESNSFDYNFLTDRLSRNVKGLRKSGDFSREVFSELCLLSTYTIKNIEDGKADKISLLSILKIACFFQIPFSDLFR